jgi:hypothetical protein
MNDEKRVLELLRDGLDQTDPVPERVRSAAEAAWTWRTIEAELASLTHDSLAESEPSLMRGADDIRSLTFESPRVTVEVELSGGGSLTGQIVPPQPARVDLQHGGATVASAIADGSGVFFLDELPAGPISLVCQSLDEPSSWLVRTEWVMP